MKKSIQSIALAAALAATGCAHAQNFSFGGGQDREMSANR